MSNLRKLKVKLWEQDPHCFWCNRRTILPVNQMGQRRQPDNMATIDHVWSRLSGRRNVRNPGEQRLVLSCYKCNHERGIYEERRKQEDEYYKQLNRTNYVDQIAD